MKKLTAMLLMICLLLTLASCGKKDEAETGVPARTFATETDMVTMTVTVQDGSFAMELLSKEPAFTGEAARREDGTYILERLEGVAGAVTLVPFRDGYYKVTAAEMVDSSLLASVLMKLNGEHSYSAHTYGKMQFSFMTEENRKILRMENSGTVMEIWNEGTAFTGYLGMGGTYNLRDRGETKLLDLEFSLLNSVSNALLRAPDAMNGSGSGTLTGDKLDITLFGDDISMSRMAENTYFGMLDGTEVILRLKADGVVELLMGGDSAIGDVRFTCVPGEKLEVITDEMVMFSFQVEGNTLTINSDQDTDGMLPLTLTEVK